MRLFIPFKVYLATKPSKTHLKIELSSFIFKILFVEMKKGQPG